MKKDATRFKFTKTALAAVACPPGKTKIRVHDTETSGLSMLVTAGGARTFYWYKWSKGKPSEVRIGSAADLTADQARAIASGYNGDAAKPDGVDPQKAKRAAREGATLADLWETYRRAVTKGVRTMEEDAGLWRRYLEAWGSRRLQDVTVDAAQKLYNRIADGKLDREGAVDSAGRKRPIKGGPIAANRTMALLSGMFSRCARTFGLAGINPAAGVEKKKETACERYLTAEELPAFWTAMGKQSALIQDMVKLALFTGQRRMTLFTMRWDEVNLNFNTWTIPAAKMKSGKAHTIPLVPAAVEILQRRKTAAAEGAEYVLASAESATGYLREPKKALKAIAKAAGIAPVTLHDLRRTLATWANSTGASEATIAAILNHKYKNVTGIYAKATADTMRTALAAATAAIVTSATPAPAKKVIAAKKHTA